MNRMKSMKLIVTLCLVLCVSAALVVPGYASEKTTSSKEAASAKAAKAGLVNINTGGVEDLVKLPRIGVKMAARIIEFRKTNGKFKKIQDIMKVKGIGEKTFKGFQHMITI